MKDRGREVFDARAEEASSLIQRSELEKKATKGYGIE